MKYYKIRYKEVEASRAYHINVSELYTKGMYRISLYGDYDPHNTEIVDVNLHRKDGRRYLESYVESIKSQAKLMSVTFSTGCCIGDLHYSLKRFKELYGNFRDMKFLDDININY